MGNAWVWGRHPDYDLCKGMLEDIGRTIKVWAVLTAGRRASARLADAKTRRYDVMCDMLDRL